MLLETGRQGPDAETGRRGIPRSGSPSGHGPAGVGNDDLDTGGMRSPQKRNHPDEHWPRQGCAPRARRSKDSTHRTCAAPSTLRVGSRRAPRKASVRRDSTGRVQGAQHASRLAIGRSGSGRQVHQGRRSPGRAAWARVGTACRPASRRLRSTRWPSAARGRRDAPMGGVERAAGAPRRGAERRLALTPSEGCMNASPCAQARAQASWGRHG
jgi:hypothetical protein